MSQPVTPRDFKINCTRVVCLDVPLIWLYGRSHGFGDWVWVGHGSGEENPLSERGGFGQIFQTFSTDEVVYFSVTFCL